MKKIKYFFEFILIVSFFFIFKIIGYKNASNLGGIIGKKLGPFFRSNTKIHENLKNAQIGNSHDDRNNLINLTFNAFLISAFYSVNFNVVSLINK